MTGAQFANLLNKLGVSVDDVAERAGISRDHLYKFRRGERGLGDEYQTHLRETLLLIGRERLQDLHDATLESMEEALSR